MIVLDLGQGRKATLFEMQRYLQSVDGEGIHLSVWWMGSRYWCECKVEPGRSLREARENGVKALTAAIKAGKHGQVTI
jgi:hypothetical protein